MSTYHPAGGQHEGTPGYPQPQDPWEGGYDSGLASVPTDPIPQQYDAYGNPQPGYEQGGLWSQPTVQQGGGYPGYPPQPARKAGQMVLVVLIVALLAGGGGFLAWYLTRTDARTSTNATSPPVTTPASTKGTSPATAATTAPGAFDPFAVNVGDCLVNDNPSDSKKPQMRVVECATAGSFEIIKIIEGEAIKQNGDGVLTEPESQEACRGSGYSNYYQSDNDGAAQDIVFCMKENK
jgi:hypothetical protein